MNTDKIIAESIAKEYAPKDNSKIIALRKLDAKAKLPATVLYPIITGGSIVMTSLAGVVVFKEKLSVRQWVSVVLCLMGTCLFL